MFRRPAFRPYPAEIPSGWRWPVLLAAVLAVVAGGGRAVAQSRITADALIGNAVSEPDSPRYSDVSEAIRRFSNRDLPGAQLLLEKARRKHPKLPPVSVMIAKMHLLAGNNQAVRPALERTIEEDADDPEPYLLLGEQALVGNRTIEADALFDKAVRLIEGFNSNAKRKRSFVIRAYKGRATVDQRRKKWELAEADLRSWLEVDPENAAAHSQLGQVLFMLDRSEDGLRSFAEAKKLDEKLPNPYVTAGAVLLQRGENAEAIRYFSQAYKENAGDETTVTQLANALIMSGDLDRAEKALQRGRQSAPDSYNLWLLSGANARLRGDSNAAEEAFLRSLTLQPAARKSFLQLTYVLVERGDEESLRRARQYAIANSRLYENNPDAQVALAWVLANSNQPRESAATLRKGLQLGTPSSDGQLLVAKMLLARDQKDTAKLFLTNALTQAKGIFVGRAEAEELLGKL